VEGKIDQNARVNCVGRRSGRCSRSSEGSTYIMKPKAIDLKDHTCKLVSLTDKAYEPAPVVSDNGFVNDLRNRLLII
jgi:hypothetical protein